MEITTNKLRFQQNTSMKMPKTFNPTFYEAGFQQQPTLLNILLLHGVYIFYNKRDSI